MATKLKLMVDVKANKVVFAEAGKDFVDYIFHLMTLPLATIPKIISYTQAMESCNLVALYQSISHFDSKSFQTYRSKDYLLAPKTASPFNKCDSCDISFYSGAFPCPFHDRTPDYVKSDTAYLVTDKMEVKPSTISFVVSLLKNLDLNYLEEQHVQVSHEQGLAIVKAVFENRDVLTSVFLQKKVKEEVNYS